MKKTILIHLFLLLQDDDGERDVTTYTVLVLEKSSVQINDLTPDTTYMFRVQALSPEGNPGSYSVEHEFHTSPLGTSNFRICRRNYFSNVSLYTFLFHMLELMEMSLSVIFVQLSLRSKTTPPW